MTELGDYAIYSNSQRLQIRRIFFLKTKPVEWFCRFTFIIANLEYSLEDKGNILHAKISNDPKTYKRISIWVARNNKSIKKLGEGFLSSLKEIKPFEHNQT